MRRPEHSHSMRCVVAPKSKCRAKSHTATALRVWLVRPPGFEPGTCGLRVRCRASHQ